MFTTIAIAALFAAASIYHVALKNEGRLNGPVSFLVAMFAALWLVERLTGSC